MNSLKQTVLELLILIVYL